MSDVYIGGKSCLVITMPILPSTRMYMFFYYGKSKMNLDYSELEVHRCRSVFVGLLEDKDLAQGKPSSDGWSLGLRSYGDVSYSSKPRRVREPWLRNSCDFCDFRWKIICKCQIPWQSHRWFGIINKSIYRVFATWSMSNVRLALWHKIYKWWIFSMPCVITRELLVHQEFPNTWMTLEGSNLNQWLLLVVYWFSPSGWVIFMGFGKEYDYS